MEVQIQTTCKARCGQSTATCCCRRRRWTRSCARCLQAVNDQEAHRQRVRAEQRITSGVSHELEERE